MANYGLVEWDQVEVKTGNLNKKDQFLRLQAGSNVVRILTKPHEYLSHRYKSNEKDPGFGEKVMSSLPHGRDVIVDRGGKRPTKRWLVGVIDRKTQSYKILDLSSSVFKSIQNLTKDEDWGNPTKYDVDIKVDKNGGATGYYAVMPKQPKPLSVDDLALSEQVDLEDLKRRCTPPTPEQMEERVRQIDEKSAAARGEIVATNSVAASVAADTASTDDGDDDFDFPAAAGSDAA